MSEDDCLRQALVPYQLILMDLDNTLYDQRDYDRGAFVEIVAGLLPQASSAERVALVERMMTHKAEKSSFYDRLFNDVQGWLEPSRLGWQDMVNLYHAHQAGSVKPERSRQALVQELVGEGRKVFVVTNGRRATQMRKIQRLELEPFLAGIYVGDPGDPDCPTKPDPTAFRRLIGDSAGLATVMVGDSETIDGGFAEQAGIPFIKTLYRSNP